MDLHQLLEREQFFDYRMSNIVIKSIDFFFWQVIQSNKCSVLFYNKLISEMITVASGNVIICMKIMT